MPIRYKVTDHEEPEPIVEVWLEADPKDGSVLLKAREAGSGKRGTVITLRTDGTMRRWQFLGKELGFQTDAHDAHKIVLSEE